jgi:folate-binding protein YgfZ
MTSDALSHEYQTARTRAGIVAFDRGLIVVSGRDRASYLQGLLTNDIVALTEGQGCYSAYLTPQGRMISDLWVHELGDAILLILPRGPKDAVLGKLDQFIFSEDVQLGDVTEAFGSLAIVGPEAASIAARALGVDEAAMESIAEKGNRRFRVGEQPAIVVRAGDTGEPGFEMAAPRDLIAALREQLVGAGAPALSAEVAELLRIEAGVPLFGRDMDEDTIPLEAGIEERAISFTKGCYVGQEVIIRVLHRGHGRVARKLVGLQFDRAGADALDSLQPGTSLHADDKAIGQITSITWSPTLSRPIGLGYVKRDFTPVGTRVVAQSGVAGEVAALPFRAS